MHASGGAPHQTHAPGLELKTLLPLVPILSLSPGLAEARQVRAVAAEPQLVTGTRMVKGGTDSCKLACDGYATIRKK